MGAAGAHRRVVAARLFVAVWRVSQLSMRWRVPRDPGGASDPSRVARGSGRDRTEGLASPGSRNRGAWCRGRLPPHSSRIINRNRNFFLI